MREIELFIVTLKILTLVTFTTVQYALHLLESFLLVCDIIMSNFYRSEKVFWLETSQL